MLSELYLAAQRNAGGSFPRLPKLMHLTSANLSEVFYLRSLADLLFAELQLLMHLAEC